MIFKATEEQVRQIAVNAAEASKPMGMGYLSWNPVLDFTTEDVIVQERGVYLDYVRGRMVKLSMHKWGDEEDWWCIAYEPDPEYQSWISTYPTNKALVESAGVNEFRGEEHSPNEQL